MQVQSLNEYVHRFDVLVAALGVVLLRLAVLEADFDVFDTFPEQNSRLLDFLELFLLIRLFQA